MQPQGLVDAGLEISQLRQRRVFRLVVVAEVLVNLGLELRVLVRMSGELHEETRQHRRNRIATVVSNLSTQHPQHGTYLPATVIKIQSPNKFNRSCGALLPLSS